MKVSKLFFVFLFFFSISLQAQEWETDFETAKTLAANQDRNIVLVFSGSDWCAPCIKLERKVWSTNTFIDYAAENFVLLKADFPKKKKNRLPKETIAQNKALAEKYNLEGIFPLVVIMNEKGEVLKTTGYEKMDVDEYIAVFNSYK